ncbi:MAG TPA: hypothetical protein VHU81_07880 [Thermoanaerobaculia bacterium]|jgi:hypothetical protein|nr:hypothetical protein [Thermoanaerobaculia bacterium]
MAEKSKLDTIANIAIIVVCIIASVVLVRNYFFTPRPQGGPPAVEKGTTLPALQAALPAGTQSALVLAVSPTCHFCTDSIPFYKRLVDERNQKGSPVKVVVAVPATEAKDQEAKMFADAGVQPDAVVPVSFTDIKVSGTPTILHVDNQGKVLGVWVGKQDESGEKKILATL